MSKNEKIFMLFLVLLIFIHFLSFSIYSNSLYYQLKFILPILFMFVWFVKVKFSIPFVSRGVWYFIILLIIAVLLSLFNSNNTFQSSIQGFSYVLLIVISFIIIPHYINNKNNYIIFLKVFLYSLLILLGINFIIGFYNLELSLTYYANRLRFKGIFNNPNSLGFFSMIGVISSIILWVLDQRKFYLFCSVLFFLYIYISDSRASLLASLVFVFVTIIFLCLNSRKITIRKITILLIYLLFTIIPIMALYGIVNSSFTLDKLDQILSGRISLSFYSISNFKNIDYLIGTGSGSRVTNPHNSFINILIELGIIGLITVYGYLLITIVKYTLVIKKTNNKFFKDMTFMLLNMILTFVIYGLAESVSITMGNLLSVFIWSNLGIHISIKKFSKC